MYFIYQNMYTHMPRKKTRNPDPSSLPMELKKHVSSIHVSGELSLLERKISNVLLLNAYDRLLTAKSHQISTALLSEVLDFDSHNIQKLKDALHTLTTTAITWDMMGDDGKNEWGVSALLAYARIKGGICTYEYSNALAKKLYNPEIYARINLGIQRKFTSSYALALYENCLRFKNVGSTGWIALDVFKKLMGTEQNTSYDLFREFNRTVLKTAISEVNKTSDLLVEVEFKRDKRKVIAVRFSVTPNAQIILTVEMADSEQFKRLPVYQRLKTWGIAERLAIQWISQYGEEYLNQKLDYTDSLEKLGHIKGAPSGFLVSAVSNDYQLPEEQKKKRTQVRRKQTLETEQQAKTQAQERKQQAKIERQKVENYLANLSKTQQEALQAAFLRAHEGDYVVMRQYHQNGFKSASVQALFREYVRQQST